MGKIKKEKKLKEKKEENEEEKSNKRKKRRGGRQRVRAREMKKKNFVLSKIYENRTVGFLQNRRQSWSTH